MLRPCSQQKTNNTVQTLQDIAHAFRIYAVCETCQRVAPIDLAKLIAQEGPAYPVNRVRMRLFCGRCRTRTQTLRIVYVGSSGRASGFRYARTLTDPG
jgi:hypothetical protein